MTTKCTPFYQKNTTNNIPGIVFAPFIPSDIIDPVTEFMHKIQKINLHFDHISNIPSDIKDLLWSCRSAKTYEYSKIDNWIKLYNVVVVDSTVYYNDDELTMVSYEPKNRDYLYTFKSWNIGYIADAMIAEGHVLKNRFGMTHDTSIPWRSGHLPGLGFPVKKQIEAKYQLSPVNPNFYGTLTVESPSDLSH